MSENGEEAVHLPDDVVKQISIYLIQNEPPGSVLLHLLSMCGVCKQWRLVAREINSGVCLGFDGLDNTFSGVVTVQRFRRLNAAQKEDTFVAAAKLFTGHRDVLCSGEGVSDRLLTELAKNCGSTLLRVKLQSVSTVTDQGLINLLSTSRKLKDLVLEDLSKSVTGKFLITLFDSCRSLQLLHMNRIPNLNWNPSKATTVFWGSKGLVKLHARAVNLDSDFGVIIGKLPLLTELEIDGPARNVRASAISCSALYRVSYQVACRNFLDEALTAFHNMPKLTHLELIIKNFSLTTEQLRLIGMLHVVDLRLDSYIYKQQPTLSRSSYSHVDNEGVKALVDSICNRPSVLAETKPLKLSLCGATALTHDAVSALLRLPILTDLDIGGCCRITAMDKMRLVAKVRAGREKLESGRRPGSVSSLISNLSRLPL